LRDICWIVLVVNDWPNNIGTIEAVRALSLNLGMPRSLSDLGCSANLIPALVEDALADEVMLNTPRVPNGDELRAVLEAAL